MKMMNYLVLNMTNDYPNEIHLTSCYLVCDKLIAKNHHLDWCTKHYRTDRVTNVTMKIYHSFPMKSVTNYYFANMMRKTTKICSDYYFANTKMLKNFFVEKNNFATENLYVPAFVFHK